MPPNLAAPGAQTRPTIGVIVSKLNSLLYQTQWQSVVNAAWKKGANVICFAGAELRSPVGFEAQGNVLYDLIDARNLSGLVIWSGALDWYITRQEMEAFARRFAPTPVVSMETPLTGIPSVITDNYQGMRDAVEHLIQVHRYRRIACLRGPTSHAGALERYRAYTDALARNGLPLDPNLVLPPTHDWSPNAAAAMTDLLLNERRLQPQRDFEAVVAPNDTMAFAVMATLEARGIRVPTDVAVIGFDNEVEASIITPPLTTVRQPFEEAGQAAVNLIFAMLHGEPAPAQVVIPTRLVVRQSCGCTSPTAIQAAIEPMTRQDETIKVALDTIRPTILTDLTQTIESPAMAEQILDAFAVELEGGPPGLFLSTLADNMRQMMRRGDLSGWQQAITALSRKTLPYLTDDALLHAENLWTQARILIGEALQRQEASQRFQFERQTWQLTQISQELITTFSIAELVELLDSQLPRLGIPSCYLALYEDPNSPTEWSRLIFAYSEEKNITLNKGQLFPSRQLIPAGLLPPRQYSLVVEPLYFHTEQIGLVVFEMGPKNGTVYEVLRGQLSSALKGALLVQQIEARARQAQALYRASQALIASENLTDTLRTVSDIVADILSTDRIILTIVDTDKQQAFDFIRQGPEQHRIAPIAFDQVFENLSGWALRERRPALSPKGAPDPRENLDAQRRRADMQAGAIVVAPLLYQDKPMGTLTAINRPDQRDFTQHDVDFMAALANQLAATLANARLLEQTQAALHNVEAVQRRYLEQAWTQYFQTAQAASYEATRPGEQPVGEQVLPEIQHAMEQRTAAVQKQPDHTALIVPSVVRGQVIGAIGVHAEAQREWTKEEMDILGEIAERMAITADNLRLVDATQRRAAREQLIGQVTARMRESLDVEKVLQIAAREFGEALGLTEVYVSLEKEPRNTQDDGK